jgi:hypothetical protein
MTHLHPVNESASEWLLRIAPVAKKLNEQSTRDGSGNGSSGNPLPVNK